MTPPLSKLQVKSEQIIALTSLWKILRVEWNLWNLGTDRRIILKFVVVKQVSNEWTGVRYNTIEAEYLVEADDYQSIKEFPVKLKESSY
jgi:hypothetical protein